MKTNQKRFQTVARNLALLFACSWMLMDAGRSQSLDELSGIIDLDVSRDGKYLATVSSAGEKKSPATISIWNITSKARQGALEGGEKSQNITFSRNGRLVAAGSRDGKINVWYTHNRSLFGTFSGHEKPVLAVQFNPGSNQLASADAAGKIHLWGMLIKEKSFSIEENKAIRALAYRPQSNVLVYGGDDPVIHFWNMTTRSRRGKLIGHSAPVVSLQFNASGKRLVSCDAEGTARLWDFDNRKLLKTFDTGAGKNTRAAFHPSGRHVLTSGEDGNLKLWESTTGKMIRDDIEAGGDVLAFRFTPDSSKFVLGTPDSISIGKVPSTKKQRESTTGRNRMIVWGKYPIQTLKTNWHVHVYKSLKKPYNWNVTWMGKRDLDIYIRTTVSGDVKLGDEMKAKQRERRKDQNQRRNNNDEDDEENDENEEKEFERREFSTKSSRGKILAGSTISNKQEGISFKVEGSKFRLKLEVSEKIGDWIKVPRNRIIVGGKGALPSSGLMTLYEEKGPPKPEVLKGLKRFKKRDMEEE